MYAGLHLGLSGIKKSLQSDCNDGSILMMSARYYIIKFYWYPVVTGHCGNSIPMHFSLRPVKGKVQCVISIRYIAYHALATIGHLCNSTVT